MEQEFEARGTRQSRDLLYNIYLLVFTGGLGLELVLLAYQASANRDV